MTVLNDGSDGSAAVVRTLGTLAPLPFIEPVDAGRVTLLPVDYGGIPVAVDYVLEPDAEYFDIRYTFGPDGAATRTVMQPVHFFVQYERMADWTPVCGFDLTATMGPAPFTAFQLDGRTSYAWESSHGDLEQLLDISGVQVDLAEPFAFCAGTEYHFARVHVGAPGLDGLLAAKARSEGVEQREITVTVEEPDGSPAVGVRVHATSGENHLTRRRTDDAGQAVLSVPADAGVEVVAHRKGSKLAGPLTVAAAETRAELAFAEDGFIHVAATDSLSGEGLRVRVMVVPAGGPPAIPDSFGERIENGAAPLEGRVSHETSGGTAFAYRDA